MERKQPRSHLACTHGRSRERDVTKRKQKRVHAPQQYHHLRHGSSLSPLLPTITNNRQAIGMPPTPSTTTHTGCLQAMTHARQEGGQTGPADRPKAINTPHTVESHASRERESKPSERPSYQPTNAKIATSSCWQVFLTRLAESATDRPPRKQQNACAMVLPAMPMLNIQHTYKQLACPSEDKHPLPLASPGKAQNGPHRAPKVRITTKPRASTSRSTPTP